MTQLKSRSDSGAAGSGTSVTLAGSNVRSVMYSSPKSTFTVRPVPGLVVPVLPLELFEFSMVPVPLERSSSLGGW